MIKQTYRGFAIEDGIPFPSRGFRRDKYPWHVLDVGDSFFVEPEDGQTLDQLMNGLTSCRNLAQRRSGWRFSMLRTHKGIRIWRRE